MHYAFRQAKPYQGGATAKPSSRGFPSSRRPCIPFPMGRPRAARSPGGMDRAGGHRTAAVRRNASVTSGRGNPHAADDATGPVVRRPGRPTRDPGR
jgi:hypothetical protein